MPETKHTQGPWGIDTNRAILALQPGGSVEDLRSIRFPIADIYSGGSGMNQADANARLIAAAPEMLEALKNVRTRMQGYRLDLDANIVLDRVNEVIAKAEGRP